MTWGLSPWGLSPWGAMAPVVPQIVSALALSEQTVLVRFATAPFARRSQIGAGDVLNPAMWSVVRADTGQSLLVLAVERQSNTSYLLHTLYKVSSYLINHVVTATLWDAAEHFAAPATFGCWGVTALRPEDTKHETIDLSNQQFEGGRPAGTLAVGPDGDYLSEGGVTLYRKLIIRRLSTLPGGFFHLPAYGIGLRLKEPLPASNMVKLRAQVELALLREPEFQRVSVRLSLSADGQLLIEVRVKIATSGQNVTIPILATPGSVDL